MAQIVALPLVYGQQGGRGPGGDQGVVPGGPDDPLNLILLQGPEVAGQHVLLRSDEHGKTLRLGKGAQPGHAARFGEQGEHVGGNRLQRPQHVGQHGLALQGQKRLAGKPVGVQTDLKQHSGSYSGISQ